MRRTRKGFTLVELLIVVAILGTLSAAMMMASKDASPKAKARQIAADLQTIAVSAAMYCSDSADAGPSAHYFMKHSDDYLFGTKLANYKLTSEDNKWYAQYKEALTGEVLEQMKLISADCGIMGNTPKMRIR